MSTISPVDIRHIVHTHLSETLGCSYDPECPKLGVLLESWYESSVWRGWHLVVDDDHLNLELHTQTRGAKSVVVVAAVELADPTSLDPGTILGLQRLATQTLTPAPGKEEGPQRISVLAVDGIALPTPA